MNNMNSYLMTCCGFCKTVSLMILVISYGVLLVLVSYTFETFDILRLGILVKMYFMEPCSFLSLTLLELLIS